MNFSRIFVEKEVADHPQTKRMLAALDNREVRYLDRVDDVFGRVKKPYLQKRDNLQLFIGKKRGQLVKQAPPAYGLSGAPHYYFIHAYNCIFECEYCYLQGYFNSPDLVFFVNHDEICEEITRLCSEVHFDQKEVWFHAGEFSDSLALSGLTREWEQYWECFANLGNGFLELRTKSVNIRPILDLAVLPNVIPSFSLAPAKAVLSHDRKTPPLAARIKAIATLAKKGYRIGIHLDPIVASPTVVEDYQILINELFSKVSVEQIHYVSIGVVRFTKEVYRTMRHHYPNSSILGSSFVTSFDGKVRYSRPERQFLLNNINKMLMEVGLDSAQIYKCME